MTGNRLNIAVFIVFVSIVLLIGYTFIAPDSNRNLSDYAALIIKTCSSEPYPPLCYDEEVLRLLNIDVSMEEAFGVTALLQGEDSRYHCHALGHKISAYETAKDPARWEDVIARCPTDQCANGCLHGVFQERYRDERISEPEYKNLISTFPTICDDSSLRTFTGQERASCYHALGHMAMYVTDSNSAESLKLCDTLPDTEKFDYAISCYDGAFMQVYQPLEPEDEALVRSFAPTSQESSRAFCEQFSGAQRDSCNRESWPLFLEDIKTSKGMQDFCSVQEPGYGQRRCYHHVISVLTPHFEFDADRLEALCKGLPGEKKENCYADVAGAHVQIDTEFVDRAASFCKRAEAEGVGEACWFELLFYSALNADPGTENLENFCAAFPPGWKERCLKGEGSEIATYDI